jgi:transcriptional regulator with XRE-family HTH domain
MTPGKRPTTAQSVQSVGPELRIESGELRHGQGDPGMVLRRLRLERKLTLAQVSERTGLPVSTLSKVETGKMSLSYGKLMSISAGLGIDIATLFNREQAPDVQTVPFGRRSITRAGEGPAIRTATYGYTYPAAELLRKSLNPMIIDVKVRRIEDFGEWMRHPGEEFAMVLQGVVDFHCDLYAPVRLEAGDTIYFDGMMGHGYIAAGDGPCRLLCVCSARDEELKSSLNPLP